MTPAERRVLEQLQLDDKPIDSPMTCSLVCGLSLADARATITSLTQQGLAAWLPPERRWEITSKGRAALQESIT